LYATIEENYGLPTIRNRELIGAIFPSNEVCKALVVNLPRPREPIDKEFLKLRYMITQETKLLL
jgi:hypothetical protein